jgi:lipocalin-like protein
MKSVGTMILSVLVGIVFAVNGAGAQEMKEKTVKGQIFGVWTVVSVVNEADGKRTEPYGANPKGQFIFTADGYFSTNIIRPDRPKFVSNNRTTRTPDENRAAVQGSNGSFGTYEISSDGSITLQIVGSKFPNWDGTKQKRLASIKGDGAQELAGSAVERQCQKAKQAEIRSSRTKLSDVIPAISQSCVPALSLSPCPRRLFTCRSLIFLPELGPCGC